MKVGPLDLPDSLLEAVKAQTLVVFAGAGVSMGPPANLPDFRGLTKLVSTGISLESEELEPEDRFLGRLFFHKVKVHDLAAKALSRDGLLPTDLHLDLLRLFRSAHQVRVVTTNFDLLFEMAVPKVYDSPVDVYSAPAIPRGLDFSGIVHIHGSTMRPSEMILTDADFGRAYLTEGWARRFLVDLFYNYAVLFVGYSYNDTIMQYLTRAIPPNGSRFALVSSDEKSEPWQMRGIVPIAFPQGSAQDFASLYEGVKELSTIISRSILDWRTEITSMARRPPSDDPDLLSTIAYALKEPATTRFFTANAKDAQWIKWLDDHNYLEPLFQMGSLSDTDRVLSWWIAEQFTFDQNVESFLLIGRHHMRLNPSFWQAIVSTITSRPSEAISLGALSRWISTLIATATHDPHPFLFQPLAKLCHESGYLSGIVSIFLFGSQQRLTISKGISWRETTKPEIDLRFSSFADLHELREIWQKYLVPEIDQIASSLLSLLLHRLRDRHSTMVAWGKADTEWDVDSYGRHAIEPHGQDDFREVLDLIIDCTRDCLEWLLKNQPIEAAYWCNLLATSEAPILRRIAVNAMTMRQDISAEDKISLLLTQFGLQSLPLHYEMFQAMKAVYPLADEEHRQMVVDAVLADTETDKKDAEAIQSDQYHKFSWIDWLLSAAPDSLRTKAAWDILKSAHPEFLQREHPDLLSWSSHCGFVSPEIPYSVEQILAKSASALLPELLTFAGRPHYGRMDRDALLAAISSAARLNLVWGMELADSLSFLNNWTTDLWDALLEAWSNSEVADQLSKPLLWMEKEAVVTNHVEAISRALWTLAKDEKRTEIVPWLPRLNHLANRLWDRLQPNTETAGPQGWLELAINRPSGMIAEFWLGSLSILLQSSASFTYELDGEYLHAFNSFLQDRSTNGRLARTLLASNIAFLLQVDGEWTKSHVLPIFSDFTERGEEADAAWDGFLTWGNLTPLAYETMAEAFLAALPHLHAELSARSARFIECFTYIVGYYLDVPLEKWIPELFRYASIEDRREFAVQVCWHLRNFSEEQQRDWWVRWLRSYCENRAVGKPASLDPQELEPMLDWLPHLSASFPECVSIMKKMQPAPIRMSSVLFELADGDLSLRYPEEMISLLLFVETCSPEGGAWFGLEKIVGKLKSANIPPQTRIRFEEFLARRGIL